MIVQHAARSDLYGRVRVVYAKSLYPSCTDLTLITVYLRSLMFMQSLADAREVGDSQKFTDAIAEYDSMTRLDGWKTQLLLRVKKRLTAVAEGEEEDLT